MQTIKRYFPMPYVAALFLASLYCGYQLWLSQGAIAWLGATLAVLPMAGFFGYLGISKTARTSRFVPWHIASATLGSVLVALDFQLTAALLAWGLGLLGNLLYVFWYAPIDRSQSHIQLGKPLPMASFVDNDGNVVTTAGNSSPQVWMFVRGNWCPLCVAQVSELAQRYRELAELGAEVFLVSNQSEQDSRHLAERFQVPIRFLRDPGAAGAKTLGIAHIGGVPVGLPGGYEPDTNMPTVVITNKAGNVIFADQTDDYRVRPEPELFIQALRQQA